MYELSMVLLCVFGMDCSLFQGHISFELPHLFVSLEFKISVLLSMKYCKT
ncbi:unnamed protein product [Brassica oleracea var. botrytis]|uniref:(rape) hypothetical protein n=1 Tax=Brassica napus TaxID=3708 RepID=A0A816RT52_BRANA|nr:unnamed protein product [Brassica napus]